MDGPWLDAWLWTTAAALADGLLVGFLGGRAGRCRACYRAGLRAGARRAPAPPTRELGPTPGEISQEALLRMLREPALYEAARVDAMARGRL